jgi:hypothetical protein
MHMVKMAGVHLARRACIMIKDIRRFVKRELYKTYSLFNLVNFGTIRRAVISLAGITWKDCSFIIHYQTSQRNACRSRKTNFAQGCYGLA